MKLLARHDPHALLFDAYGRTVEALVDEDEATTQTALRAFELVLLREIGLLPDLGLETASHRPVRPEGRYLVLADAGVVETSDENEASLAGTTLSALELALAGDLAALQRVAASALAALRPLLRAPLHSQRGPWQLRTRQVMIEAQALDR
jgi:DNA repair protein RecO (recombination protein O)